MSFEEIWKRIPGFDNRYEASSLGRIRCERKGWARNRDPLVSCYRQHNGYLRCALVTETGTCQKGVHQLVALAFLGPCPEGCEVNHKNCDKTDNRPENLEYITHEANLMYSRTLGAWKPKQVKGERINTAKLTASDVLTIRQMLAEGHRVGEIAKLYNVSTTAISLINTGKNWKHLLPANKGEDV